MSVVFPAYNEEGNIRQAVDDFFLSGVVDEIVVVDNNSRDGTVREASRTQARIVQEPIQGYGAALARGLREAAGDLVVLAEPDGTFAGRDLTKLLAFAADYEMVCGSRTSRELIASEARMGPSIRIANVILARLLKALFDTCPLSDCGCTLRLIHREALHRFIDELSVTGSHFLPEMVILARLHRVSMIEVPVAYGKRVGQSKITGSLTGAVRTGARMLGLILWRRITSAAAGRRSKGRQQPGSVFP